MRLCSLVVSIFLIGLAVPVSAQQQSTRHLYMIQFKATAQSTKEMIDNPQDRTGPSRKLLEAFGGRLLDYYVYPPGEYDGMLIVELPDDMAVRAAAMTVLSAGAIEKMNIVPLITAEEWKKVMEMARQTVSGYTAPAQTK